MKSLLLKFNDSYITACMLVLDIKFQFGPTLDDHSIYLNRAGFIQFYQKIEFLLSVSISSFILGMICCGCFFIPLFIIRKRCAHPRSKKPNIELSENLAYETIPYPRPNVQDKHLMQ